jgi:phytanoyl-CoA hydroxylase
MHRIDPDQAAQFRESGFLALEGFASPEACDALRRRAAALVEQFDPEGVVSIFSTREQTRTSDDYFLGSGDKIRFFFEEAAFGPGGELSQPKELSINKIGHALHDLDPEFDRFSRTRDLASLAADLGFKRPLLLQSMYIFKQPGIGGEVGCHQDSAFLYTEPPSAVGFWFALEDATVENGCLHAIPGGHRAGLKSRFVRAPGGGTRVDLLDESPWPLESLVPLEAPAGTLILLDGLLPHMSYPNNSPKSRHAYTLHVIEGDSVYAVGNWLQRGPELPLRGFESAASG